MARLLVENQEVQADLDVSSAERYQDAVLGEVASGQSSTAIPKLEPVVVSSSPYLRTRENKTRNTREGHTERFRVFSPSRTFSQVAEPKLIRDFSVCQSQIPCLLFLDFGRQTATRVDMCACDEKWWMKNARSGVWSLSLVTHTCIYQRIALHRVYPSFSIYHDFFLLSHSSGC